MIRERKGPRGLPSPAAPPGPPPATRGLRREGPPGPPRARRRDRPAGPPATPRPRLRRRAPCGRPATTSASSTPRSSLAGRASSAGSCPRGGRRSWASRRPRPSLGPALALAATVKKSDPAPPSSSAECMPTLFPGEVLRDRERRLRGARRGRAHRSGAARGSRRRRAPGRDPRDRIPGRQAAAGERRRGPRSPISTSSRGPPTTCCPWGATRPPSRPPGTVTSMVTSRGCPYPCTFCDASVVHGRKYRAHSAERVVAEIRDLVREHGVRRGALQGQRVHDRPRPGRPLLRPDDRRRSSRHLDVQRPRRPRRRDRC